jgi:uncharacterized membrane-anchored protein
MHAPTRWGCVMVLVGLMAASLADVTPAAAQRDSAKVALFKSIDWTSGPVTGGLGTEAEVGVPATCRFTGAKGTKTFMEVTENPPSGHEHGMLLCEAADTASGTWFVVFTYEESGYVKDDEGQSLDADAILKTLQEGNEEGNEERKARGWAPLYIDGWERRPFYDARTHNLTWSTRVHSETGGISINHSVRLLGRGGVMHADLVADPAQMATAVPALDSILSAYHFKAGRTYAEWRQGDKVAAYGLTALIAGGAGAAAMKTGLLAKSWKLIVGFFAAAWKLVAVAVAGAIAWIKSLFQQKKRDPAAGGPPAP